MKCANCDRDAFYVYQITKSVDVLYCGIHLPNFLEARRRAGNLRTTEAPKTERESAIAVLETAVEEPTAPKPRKRTKKAAENNEGNS